MRRRNRVLTAVVSAATSVGIVIALMLAGSASEGPLERMLHKLGSALGRAESGAARKLRGPGRIDEYQWVARFRDDRNALLQPDTLLLGTYDDGLPLSLEGVLTLERAIGHALPLVQVYTAWGDKRDQAFPDRIVDAIDAIGSIPVITWEPWLTDFENRLHPELPLRTERDRNGLSAIANGAYDFYIDQWARAAAARKQLIMVRLAHEMNDPYRYPWGPQNNQPQDFIAAWRHVVDRFRLAGANNVLWVWSPHLAYAGWEQYWPGDEYVDWVATGALNYGTVAAWSNWWSFSDIFGRHYASLAGLRKPIMIAEFGAVAVGGDRARWYGDALTSIHTDYPAVRAVLFFNVHSDKTVTYQSIDWSFTSDSAALAAVRAALGGRQQR